MSSLVAFQTSEMANTEPAGSCSSVAMACFYILFVQNGKIVSTFDYTTLNFRNIYCRYVILHFVCFHLITGG